MKRIITMLLITLPLTSNATGGCFRVCMKWDKFCKTPPQIVATKCRLGVPVKHDQCASLGIPEHYMIRGGGSLVNAMPCTTIETGKSTAEIVAPYIKKR